MSLKCECKLRRDYRSLVVSVFSFAIGVMSSFARGVHTVTEMIAEVKDSGDVGKIDFKPSETSCKTKG